MTAWTIARGELRNIFKDRMFIFWMIVFPLIFGFVFGLAFREDSSGALKVSLHVEDNDASFLSRALIEELVSEKYALTTTIEEGDEPVRTLVIPAGFAADVAAGTKVELVLQQEQGKNMEAMQSAYSHVLKAVVTILTKIVKMADTTGISEERFAEMDINRLITLRAELGGELKGIPSGFNHSVPAMAVVFLLFTIFMYGGIGILEERRKGLLERLYLSPATFLSIIMGKWTARIIIGLLQLLLLFAAGRLIFKVYLGPSLPGLILVSLVFSAAIGALSILFGSLFKKMEVLIVFNILLANIMAALGGCWWPLEMVPRGLRMVGFAFPTGWIMDAYHKLIFFGLGLEYILPNLAVLSGYTIVFLFLAVRFFKIRK
ncbi:MAG: ABC transporter permease [Candidatus Aminicenantes bacterium]|nr:ABC transporter permease [Candidatus Aminicenantes bacterium]